MTPALRLRLHQFRCHAELELHLPTGRHFFFGHNGNGKTTVLEALYYVSRLRSFRTALPRELAAHGSQVFRVEADVYGRGAAAAAGSDNDGFYDADDPDKLCVTWENGARSLLLNDQPPRLAEFWGRLPTVLFEDGDRAIVTGPGAGRRAWVDGLAAQRDPSYVALAQRYARALKQRNAWLKSHGGDRAVGDVLTAQLTGLGRAVTERRAALSRELNALWPSALAKMGVPSAMAMAARTPGAAGAGEEWDAADTEFCGILYEPSFCVDRTAAAGGEACFVAREPDWNSVAGAEHRQQVTLLGPHRDDWKLVLGGKALAKFGSEGQQRAGALALRLAEAELIRRKRDTWPVFLMDDVTPQLDDARRAALEAQLPAEALILITSPEDRGWARPGSGDCVWQVSPGRAELARWN
ncbi:hypothetical protein DB346_06090 [Verrucomicrobia bacterium LW23]|nr:hypothetical protein DB346_06090 [Verrucomicrobia bacterium LW23]